MKHLVLLSLLFPLAIHAQQPTTPALQVQDASVQAVPVGSTTRVTARLINRTSESIVISKLSSPLAQNSRMVIYGKDADGLLNMSEQASLTVPVGETLILPNVLEWRLENMQTSLSEGTEIPLTFTFDNGTARTFKAKVK